MSANVKIGNDVINDAKSVRLESADTAGTYVTFLLTNDANATQADIALGKTAYVNGVKITGNATEQTIYDEINQTAYGTPAPTGYTATFTRDTPSGYLEFQDDWSNIVQYSVDNGATYNAFVITTDGQGYYIPADITGLTQIKFRVRNYGAYINVKVKQDSTVLCQSTSTTWVESSNITLSADTTFAIGCILDN